MGLAVGTAKYLLFFFNFIFFATGILIIVVASMAISKSKNLVDHLDDASGLNAVPIFLIIVGLIVAFISFFGCCGAIRNSYCMLMTFASILALIFIFELAAGIAAYTKKDSIKETVHKAFDEMVKEYYSNNTTKEQKDAVDALQKDFKCCGSNNSSDWKGHDIPKSCCSDLDNCSKDKDKYFEAGCYDAFNNFISDNAAALGGVGVGIAFIQILGIVLACCMGSAVKNHV